MLQNKNIFFVLILSIIISACSSTSVRRSENYEKHLHTCFSMAVIPASAESYTVAAFGKKTRNENYEYLLEDVITSVATDKLREKGYKAKIFSKRIAHDNKISSEIYKIQEDSKGALSKIYKANNPNLNEKEAYKTKAKLTNNFSKLYQIADADLAVLLEYSMHNKTSGALAADLLIGSLSSRLVGGSSNTGPAEGATLRLSIFNLKTNELVWANIISTSSGLGSLLTTKSNKEVEQKRVAYILDKLLKDLPNR